MFDYVESAILSHPYVGEARLANERFGPWCVKIMSERTFVGSGFTVAEQLSIGCRCPRNPIVAYASGLAARAEVNGLGPWAFLTNVYDPVPSWHFRQAEKGEIVFCLGYRSGVYTLGWGEIAEGRTKVTCEEQDADGGVIVSRTGLILGMTSFWDAGRYRCFQFEGQLPNLTTS